MHSGARGGHSNSFFRREWLDDFPGSVREAFFCTYLPGTVVMLSVSFLRLSYAVSIQSRHVPGTQQKTCAHIPSLQRCRLHALRVRHAHMRSIAMVGCVYRSLPCAFHRLPYQVPYLFLLEVLPYISLSERARLTHPWPLRASTWTTPLSIPYRTFPAVLCFLQFSRFRLFSFFFFTSFASCACVYSVHGTAGGPGATAGVSR